MIFHDKQMVCSTCYFAYRNRVEPLIYDNEKHEWKHKNGNGACLRDPEPVEFRTLPTSRSDSK